jgi:hypothetical protein
MALAPSPLRAAFGRLVVAHFLAYPIGFAAAVGSIPLALLVRERALLAAEGGAKSKLVRDALEGMALGSTEAAQVEVILELVLWIALAVVLIVHLAAVPWAIGAARSARRPGDDGPARRGMRTFVVICAATTALVVLGAVVGWVWVITL